MKRSVSKILLLGAAMVVSLAGYAQEEKYKEERDGYELKIKREGNDHKVKEKGKRPAARYEDQTIIRRGQTITTVKRGTTPATAPSVARKSYSGTRKQCNCKTVASRSKAKSRSVAYKSKARTQRSALAARTAVNKRVVVRDTVYMVRVDTVFTMQQTDRFTGYRSGTRLRDDLKKFKIKRDGDEIILKKEYENGDKVKKSFESEEDLQTYLQWLND